ncbi:NAD(+) diphosphatase [Parasalinivibrio latis]|uniref:NAD(+) diphosphatase n=1 Tax=Parasalinivibrio latis TaxID=2952610 RepID=UPI0030DF2332
MSQISEEVYICAAKSGQIWLKDGSLPLMPLSLMPYSSGIQRKIGEFQGKPVWWISVSDDSFDNHLFSLRELLGSPVDLFMLAGKAIQLEHMLRDQPFCSRCGGQNDIDPVDHAMRCVKCDSLHYPRVSPCVIVAVKKKAHILLAQHPRHKNGMYTVIAGFVEPGETLEQCVEREVFEETGIRVANIRYVGSQPWAFPSNLMMGFLADYASGEITPDYAELTDAAWFSPDELPEVAPKGTIARELIEMTCGLISG